MLDIREISIKCTILLIKYRLLKEDNEIIMNGNGEIGKFMWYENHKEKILLIGLWLFNNENTDCLWKYGTNCK